MSESLIEGRRKVGNSERIKVSLHLNHVIVGGIGGTPRSVKVNSEDDAERVTEMERTGRREKDQTLLSLKAVGNELEC